MPQPLPQLLLLAFLIGLNAVFAGSEMALVTLRDSQLARLERQSRTGRTLARLARDPNRFLSTTQVGITLAGFLASAIAAVTLADPLVGPLGFLGGAAKPVAIVLVTIALTFVTLVLGELAPKRLAMQGAERWGLVAAGPLAMGARLAAPVVWVLGRSTDGVVRLLGGDPRRHREEISREELRDLALSQSSFSPGQRRIISGAFEIGDRTLGEVMIPRSRVLTVPAAMDATEALATLVGSGHSRAPVVSAGLDDAAGVVHLRDLIDRPGRTAGDVAGELLALPESLLVVGALRTMQAKHQQLAVVVNEHGGAEGIVTVEDLIEELVGEIYDEIDRNVLEVVREPGGSFLIPGSFPMHDLVDLGIELPEGEYTTVAGLVLDRLGHIPRRPGDLVAFDRWTVEVVEVGGRAVTRVRVSPRDGNAAPNRAT